MPLKTNILNFFRRVFMMPAAEKILARVTQNKSLGSYIIKLIPNNYQYSRGTIRFATRNGINYKLHLQDYMDWLLFFGIKEKGRESLYQLVKKNDTVIDVGTNTGEVLMNFAVLTGNLGKVHGFEPDSVNHKRCTENLKLNNFRNIQLNQAGLGDNSGKYNIKVNTQSNRGGNRITRDHGENTEEITVITLDEYVENNSIPVVNVIKIDVEGFELNVLKGSENILNRLKPILFIEVDDNNLKEQGHSAKELIQFVQEKGYKTVNAETDKGVSASEDFTNCHFDIICSQEE